MIENLILYANTTNTEQLSGPKKLPGPLRKRPLICFTSDVVCLLTSMRNTPSQDTCRCTRVMKACSWSGHLTSWWVDPVSKKRASFGIMHSLSTYMMLSTYTAINMVRNSINQRLRTGLSKVAGCRRKSPPTWLVLAGYSAWHFFTNSIF